MKKGLKAFSLIELSIVILIIGILIAGVTQASRLVKQMRLTSARTLTQSSPVASIKGLALWLESTADASFKVAESEDGAFVTWWGETNPQVVNKNNVSRVASDNKFTFEDSGINNLPSLSCDNSDGSALNGNLLDTTQKDKFTIVAVYQSRTPGDNVWRSIFGTGSGSGFFLQKSGSVPPNSNKRNISALTVVDIYGGLMTADPEIAVATYDGTNINLYINGAAETLSASTATIAPSSGQIYIGNSWQGFIGEIIVFDGVLKSTDRKDVEKYLGKKWGIKVS